MPYTRNYDGKLGASKLGQIKFMRVLGVVCGAEASDFVGNQQLLLDTVERRLLSIIMPVPFEALIPYGIVLAMFGATGAGLSKLKHWQNGNKRQRRSLDQWDRQSTNFEPRLHSRG
ncbi:hypothetical protein GGR58DRAFT_500512 [Xylaria digitata]|nr:hypothetical protein GGR58DRAFT_500512 [Xylaria digitata]